MLSTEVLDRTVQELVDLLGKENVLTEMRHKVTRSASCSPFPVQRWKDHLPDIVVLPSTTEDVVGIVKIANKYKVPIVPRGGGSGLADGAVPLKHGIVIDIKKMNQILEIDEENMTVTVQTGINLLRLNEVLGKLGYWHPDDPAGYINATVGGRIGCSGLSLVGSGHGHTRDLVVSLKHVLPTGEVIHVGEGGGKKIRKSAVGYRLKDLFIGHQGTLGIATEAVLEIFPRPEAVFPAFFAFKSFEENYKAVYKLGTSGLKTLSALIMYDERKIEYLKRDDEAFIPLRDDDRSVICTVLYGTNAEVNEAKKVIFKIAKECGGRYLGQEMSEGDWASRHDRYHIPFHGRRADGQVVLLSWHCEDAAINYSELPRVKEKWHKIVNKYVEKHDGIFDNWGMFMYTANAYKPWGDYLVEIDIGVNELAMTEEIWQDWLKMKEEIAKVVVEHEGTISCCHGGTRPGDEEVVIYEELGPNGNYELMKKIKKLLDPNNIMNPNKYLLDNAYKEE
ncbi:FAD-binding oxidoreductase [Calidifontibacillus erzurumensis]|uniref:D-lactate dehydrogenase (cytochrome) n=1 Tax=Calidifontibacillus erzurumensis TaxID=2741433 RepID=A0A8J8GE82_9BACI|nr:FAD-binding oxidoreductase [Calidifontibacillus erzurumensis]NSL51899.1 FAD-binding oxidoreductase [Calidifontibacillus erzurumensis]